MYPLWLIYIFVYQKNTSQQNSEFSMDNMNVTELFNDIYEIQETVTIKLLV